jgi:hypothetical protein
MDPKVTKLMDKVGVDNLNDFRRKSTVNAVKGLEACFAKSTLEDYTWRLVKELKNTPNFPSRSITPYRKLWKENGGQPKYKKKPTGNPTGRPPGAKNKC